MLTHIFLCHSGCSIEGDVVEGDPTSLDGFRVVINRAVGGTNTFQCVTSNADNAMLQYSLFTMMFLSGTSINDTSTSFNSSVISVPPPAPPPPQRKSESDNGPKRLSSLPNFGPPVTNMSVISVDPSMMTPQMYGVGTPPDPVAPNKVCSLVLSNYASRETKIHTLNVLMITCLFCFRKIYLMTQRPVTTLLELLRLLRIRLLLLFKVCTQTSDRSSEPTLWCDNVDVGLFCFRTK